MPPSITEPKFLLDLAQWVFMGVVSVVLWLRRPGEDAAAESKKVRAQLSVVSRELTNRIVQLEHHSKQVPSRIELAELEGEVKTIRVQMEGQNQQLLTIQHSLHRVENFLLDSARRHNSNTNY
ncbi:hypothetical protein [Sphaerotilus sp.]|uniref:hypothetical protein n=1 Tax=Sphaerotilus sp. TaxID=2093942 RepID=UPI00286DEDE3|nr:hypothetical protein [Sphaerotilus sp.]